MGKKKNAFYEQCQNIYEMVNNSNSDPRSKLSSSHTRFNFFTETNAKGLYVFGVYDHHSKKYELVDVFDPDLSSKVKRMKEILTRFYEPNPELEKR